MALFGSLSDLPGLPLSTDALKGAQQWREGVGRKARLKTQIQPVLKKRRRFDISNQNQHHNDALLDLTHALGNCLTDVVSGQKLSIRDPRGVVMPFQHRRDSFNYVRVCNRMANEHRELFRLACALSFFRRSSLTLRRQLVQKRYDLGVTGVGVVLDYFEATIESQPAFLRRIEPIRRKQREVSIERARVYRCKSIEDAVEIRIRTTETDKQYGVSCEECL
jgi:hypothetical protein